MSKLPLVAIVGRTNVGKSSLFNRLLGYRRAIVADEPGTTRDNVFALINTGRQVFTLADTAGLKLDPADRFETTIQDQITEAAAAADVILVVVEAGSVFSDEDRRVAKIALKSGRALILAVNKIDRVRRYGAVAEWRKSGIKTIISTSATQGTGLDRLVALLEESLPVGGKPGPEPDMTIALIGRPNVGKSSLFNALGKKQQALVSEQAGTTRDINEIDIRYHAQTLRLVDTAGIRRPGRIERGVEHFSVLRAVAAIESADVCLLLLDAHEPAVHLEQKLAGMIAAAGKGLIMTVSKWDSIEKDDKTADQISNRVAGDFQHVWWAPLVFTSAETGQNVTKIFELAQMIMRRRSQQLQTAELNNLLERVADEHPPAGLKNRHPKLRYITQSDTNPPSFRIYGSQTSFLHWSYKRYLEKQLRATHDFTGTPIKLYFSDKEAR